jgi:hypothetical protein
MPRVKKDSIHNKLISHSSYYRILAGTILVYYYVRLEDKAMLVEEIRVI